MLKNLLFTIILVVGCSLVVFGQSTNPPPKKDPPVVPVKPKPTPTPTPTPPKKSQDEIALSLQGVGKVES